MPGASAGPAAGTVSGPMSRRMASALQPVSCARVLASRLLRYAKKYNGALVYAAYEGSASARKPLVLVYEVHA